MQTLPTLAPAPIWREAFKACSTLSHCPAETLDPAVLLQELVELEQVVVGERRADRVGLAQLGGEIVNCGAERGTRFEITVNIAEG